ncbi:MAG: S1 RNA-binding domain-containing protein [Anaerolineales bacterium]|nr:S1 RNA-binding domain-containing protein [Anaerolineales bacterium]
MANEVLQTPETIEDLEPKMKVAGKVLKTSLAGAIVDIGVGVPGVIHISRIQKGSVSRVSDVLSEGQEVEVWIQRADPEGKKIELTMLEPVGLDWGDIKPDMELVGIVTRIEKYGVFVDIEAERPGLVHISEMAHGYVRTPTDIVQNGDQVNVKVLKVNRRKKQIKLSMKALEDPPQENFVIEDDEDEKKEVTPTAIEAAIRKAMESNEEKSELADLLSEFKN